MTKSNSTITAHANPNFECGFFYWIITLNNYRSQCIYQMYSYDVKRELEYGFWLNIVVDVNVVVAFSVSIKTNSELMMQWQRLICQWMVYVEFIYQIHLKFQIFEMLLLTRSNQWNAILPSIFSSRSENKVAACIAQASSLRFTFSW